MQNQMVSDVSTGELIRQAQRTLKEARLILGESILLRLELQEHRATARAVLAWAHEDEDAEGSRARRHFPVDNRAIISSLH